MAALDAFFARLSELSGLSPSAAALLIGVCLGFALRTLFSPRIASDASAFNQPPQIASSSAIPASRFHQRQSAGPGEQVALRFQIDEARLEEIRRLLKSGNKIGAIKAFREATDVGLAEAKSAVEAIERLLP